MEIILAEQAGFCWGVKRAIEIAIAASQKSSNTLYVLGHLIHNEAVVQKLDNIGIKVIEHWSVAEPGSTVLITAHGLDYRIIRQAKEKGFQVIDTTCPIIQKVHRFTRQFLHEQRQIIIIGNPEHIEVKGIISYADGKAEIVSRIDEIERLNLGRSDKLGVVVQTTFNIPKMQAIIQRLQQQSATTNVMVRNTICPDVMGKQNEVKELAAIVDAVIVVGSKSSSNTTRLFEIAREICEKSYFVSRASELYVVNLHGVEKIAVTGGASTPDWIIDEVLEYLNRLALNQSIFEVKSTTVPLMSPI
ncbi:4-hydroxy-3-methylbut-2-enyl diphosphate reductase [bacterium]|nr:4-hydroxy-3-methylbut-2-enyl diphosphate reductase [bacterium]